MNKKTLKLMAVFWGLIIFLAVGNPVYAACGEPQSNGASSRTPCATPLCYDSTSLSTKVTNSYYVICDNVKRVYTETKVECCR